MKQYWNKGVLRRSADTKDRRKESRDPHRMIVKRDGEALQVVCTCGKEFSRFADKAEISLSDMLELVREHSSQGGYG